MNILFDNGTPRGLRSALPHHLIQEARALGWDRLKNGALLEAAEVAQFDLLITTDQSMRYQQNLSTRRIAILILGSSNWPLVERHLKRIATAVDGIVPGTVTEFDIP